jgi:tRNA threonylcarbamoyl adenosine modification protein YjeE
VYGLLVDAKNENAVRKLISFKQRPIGKAISIFVDGFEMLERVVDTRALTPSARSLLPGPYTLVLPSMHHVSRFLEAEDGSLGVRLIGKQIPNLKFQIQNSVQYQNSTTQISSIILSEAERSQKIPNELDTQPNYVIPGVSRDLTRGDSSMRWNDKVTFESLSSPADFVTTLVHVFGGPVTATSANLAGKPSCSSIDALLSQLSSEKKSHIDLIIDIGALPTRKPSTVMSFLAETPQLLRTGDKPISHVNTYTSHSTADTHRIASEICTILRANRDTTRPTVLLLDGEMGAGKTTFMQGFARSMGILRIVSPTYTYECEYDIPQMSVDQGWEVLRHYDLYHIQSDEDLRALRIIPRLTPHMLACIEWPGRMSGVIR